jgi:hypothetical protein
MQIRINILYWDNKEKQRFDNTNLSWYYLNKFISYANDKGLDIKGFLFDLSEDKVLDDAIHIPFEKGSYKRSHKINKVIEYHGNDEYIFSVMDSDLIIAEKDYDSFIYLLQSMKDNCFYVFKLNDLLNTKGVDYENKIIDFKQLEYKNRKFNPDLGGLFFLDIKLLKEIGGFDEEIIVWSCEDNIAALKLLKNGYRKIILPITPYHLPHINLMDKVFGTPQYKKQVEKYYKLVNEK